MRTVILRSAIALASSLAFLPSQADAQGKPLDKTIVELALDVNAADGEFDYLLGAVGCLTDEDDNNAVVDLLCGDSCPPTEIAASALSEFGNILVSQTASAIANTLGGRIMPSLPELVLSGAEAAFEARTSPRHRPPPPLYIESELFDRQGRFRALHVFLPRVDKSAIRA